MGHPASKRDSTPSMAVGMYEAARHLGICRQHVYRLVAAGELNTFKIGRRRLITRDEIRRFIKAKEESV